MAQMTLVQFNVTLLCGGMYVPVEVSLVVIASPWWERLACEGVDMMSQITMPIRDENRVQCVWVLTDYEGGRHRLNDH